MRLTRDTASASVFPTDRHAGAMMLRSDIYGLFIDSRTRPRIVPVAEGSALAAIDADGKTQGWLALHPA